MNHWVWIVLFSMGCDSLLSTNKQYCKEVSDCIGGDRYDERACASNMDASKRVAKVYGCDRDYADYISCMKEEAACEKRRSTGLWTDNGWCSEDLNEYMNCLPDDVFTGLPHPSQLGETACDQYVEYLCVCAPELCEDLRSTYANADPEVQQLCAESLEETAAAAASCAESGVEEGGGSGGE